MQTMTPRKLYGKPNSFMRTMRYSTARKMVEGQQALIDDLQTWLTIYEEKFKEAIAMMQSDFNNSDCAGLAKHGSWVQH